MNVDLVEISSRAVERLIEQIRRQLPEGPDKDEILGLLVGDKGAFVELYREMLAAELADD